MRLNVGMERRQCQSIKICRREYFTYHPHRNELCTPALIAKAADGEGPRVGRSGQVRD